MIHELTIEVFSESAINACVKVLAELRTSLTESRILDQITRQMKSGYRLAYLEEGDDVRAVAGFRFAEYLAWGRAMYVDDLVCREADRGKGYGGQLLDWLIAHAREKGCDQFHLDSGTHRVDAHRFYKAHGMDITSYHFALKL